MSEALHDDHIIRDIDPDTEADGRLVPRGFWRTGSGTDKRDTYEHSGSFDCYGMWPATQDDPDRTAHSIANAYPAWWQTTKAKDKDGALPARDLGLEPDLRFMLLDEVSPGKARRLPLTPDIAAPRASAPEGDKELKTPRVSSITGRPIPLGAPGVVIPGLEERAQAALFFPAWDGALMAPHLGEDHANKAFEYATRVMDLDDVKRGGTGRAYGEAVIAGLHSVWRVQRLPGKTAPGIDLGTRGQVCWNLTGAGDGSGPGYGAYHATGDGGGATGEEAFGTSTSTPRTDDPFRTRVNAFTSWEMGGPFHPGHEADAHSCGGTGVPGDAPWNAGHLHIRSLWYSSPSFDAPLEFQERFEPQVSPGFGLATRVHLTMDGTGRHSWAGGTAPGLWRWHTMLAAYSDPPLEPPGTPEGPGTPGSPTPPGTPGGPETIPPTTVGRIPGTGRWSDPVAVRGVRSAGSLTEWTVPSLAFRAVPYGTRRFDPRYQATEWNEEMLADLRKLPIVARLDAYGYEDGVGGFSGSEDADPRYAVNATRQGSLALLPGNVGLEDLASSLAPSGRQSRAAYLTLPPTVARLAFGLPDTTTGRAKSGFGVFQDGVAGSLRIDTIDSTGTATQRAAIRSDGGVTVGSVTERRYGDGPSDVFEGTALTTLLTATIPEAALTQGTRISVLTSFEKTTSVADSFWALYLNGVLVSSATAADITGGGAFTSIALDLFVQKDGASGRVNCHTRQTDSAAATDFDVAVSTAVALNAACALDLRVSQASASDDVRALGWTVIVETPA